MFERARLKPIELVYAQTQSELLSNLKNRPKSNNTDRAI